MRLPTQFVIRYNIFQENPILNQIFFNIPQFFIANNYRYFIFFSKPALHQLFDRENLISGKSQWAWCYPGLNNFSSGKTKKMVHPKETAGLKNCVK